MTAQQLEAARYVVSPLYRHCLVDGWVRDEEVWWTADEAGRTEQLASGYQGRRSKVGVKIGGEWIRFEGEAARQLIELGKKGQTHWN